MTRVALSTGIVVALLASGLAQSARDFSGTWSLDLARSESAHQAEPAGVTLLVVTQTERDLAFETRRPQDSQTLIYRRDGADYVNRIAGDTVTTRMRWDGPRLVTEAVFNLKGFPVTTRQVRTLSPDANEMAVDALVRIEHGYLWNFSKDNPPHYGRGKDVYVRVPTE